MEPTQEQIDAANREKDAASERARQAEAQLAESNRQLAQFSEQRRTEQHQAHVSFADGAVKAAKLLPKDKDMAVATMGLLADAKPVEFSEGTTTRKVSPLQWFQDFVTNAKPVVQFGEHATGLVTGGDAGNAHGKTDAEVHQAAKAHQRANPNVSFADALAHVTTFSA